VNPVARQVAFTVSGREVPWTEVIDHARETGAWQLLVNDVANGLASTGRASPEALKRACNQFRYARGLVAGDDLREWLDRWGLTVTDWRDHFRRELLAKGHHVVATEIAHEPLWASAVCSGTLEEAAEELAGLLAAGEWITDQSGTTITPYEVRSELAKALANDEAIKAQVQSRALDWIRIESSVLSFDSPDAAREALTLLRHDGLRADEVAAIAQAPHELRTEHLIDVEEDRRAVLLGAREGDVLGPLKTDDGFCVMVVQRKQTATLDDSQVRGLATESLVERVIRRETDERVVWRGGH
jgi:hypothetical protein